MKTRYVSQFTPNGHKQSNMTPYSAVVKMCLPRILSGDLGRDDRVFESKNVSDAPV